MSRSRGTAIEMIKSGEALWAYPLATLLMLATAGFTEEFFFRGLVLTRIRRWTRSALVAIVLSALCFGVYHLPYAYLNPRWPSHGDWGAAAAAAFGQGGTMGIVLGAVFVLAGENLTAVIFAHACFNAGWAMTMLQR
jgi:membrane protease YdiL (CAAX protease family)